MRGNQQLNEMIQKGYKSQAEMARKIGWSRQKMNKITTGRQKPDITDLNLLANALGCEVIVLLNIFLQQESTNGQQL